MPETENGASQNNGVAAEAETPDPPELQDHFTASVGKPDSDSVPDTSHNPSVAWTASEFVHHDKSVGWYVALALADLLLAALIFILTKDPVSVGVIIVAGLLLGTYGAHQPRQLKYRLDEQGVGVGAKYRSYYEFRSFSIVPEGVFSSIIFMPLKRFALPITIYFAPDDEEDILAILADKLPIEPHQHDLVDRLIRRIRF